MLKDILDKNLTDKFKHAFLNCKGAQYGFQNLCGKETRPGQ